MKTQMENTRKIFISYDSQDIEIAESFVNMIEDISENEIQIFTAENKNKEKGFRFGDNWYEKLIKIIKEVDTVIVILTSRSINSKWVLFEAGYSKGLNKKVFGINIFNNTVLGPFSQIQSMMANYHKSYFWSSS